MGRNVKRGTGKRQLSGILSCAKGNPRLGGFLMGAVDDARKNWKAKGGVLLKGKRK